MVSLECGDLLIEGESSSAVATYIRVKELDLIFDLGRCPMSFIGTGHVFISHFHLDHYFGLPIYISQRWLAGIPPGKIYVPKAGVEQVRNILDRISRLDCGVVWDYQVTPVLSGDRIPFRQNLAAHVLPGYHRVPSVGYLICETREKLKPEFHGLPGKEIAELRRSGTKVTAPVELPLIAYLGDTQRVDLDAHPLLRQCKVLICECTFLTPEHRKRAEISMHLHLDDMPALMTAFESEHVVLTHFSRRYTPDVIRQRISTALSPDDLARIQLLI